MKKILIAMRELDCGGTEVAMLNLLKVLDKSKYDITLLLMRKRGIYLSRIPSHIKIVEIPFYRECNRYYISDDSKLAKNKLQRYLIKINRKLLKEFDKYAKKIDYKFDIYYSYLLKKTKQLEEEYDLVLDFFGYGGFQSAYISKEVKAPKKIMWIHDERLLSIGNTRCYFDKFTYFFGVSKACSRMFSMEFPETADRVGVFYNFIDKNEILSKSEDIIDNKLFKSSKFNIVSVGRLEWQKGFDLAIEVAKKLKEKNIQFCWYALGEGSCRNELQKKIDSYKLKDEFILLGRIDNPYPYIKKADLYVQTSRHEGYGLAIAEARILNKAIVSTDLECVREQIIDGENGYLVPFDEEEFLNTIIKLYENSELRSELEKTLKDNQQEYIEELNKLEIFL